MPAHQNYFRYFALHPDAQRWGLGLTAAGWMRVPPGQPYPSPGHPSDRQFDWDHGRVLDRLQILLVTAGRGTLETGDTGTRTISAGTAFALLPGHWHRYRPDLATGWDESWIELCGPVVEQLLAGSVLSADGIIRPSALSVGLDAALDAVHARARTAPPSFDPEFSALGLAVLAAWAGTDQAELGYSRIARTVATAEKYFATHYAESINVAELARRLGVAYSHFRREFKARTGFSPWQYVLHLRLARARRLLVSSDATLEDIAIRLGFSSAFHLSTDFKQAFGLSPHHWRRQVEGELRPFARRRPVPRSRYVDRSAAG